MKNVKSVNEILEKVGFTGKSIKCLHYNLHKSVTYDNKLVDIIEAENGRFVTVPSCENNSFLPFGNYALVLQKSDDATIDFSKEIVMFNLETGNLTKANITGVGKLSVSKIILLNWNILVLLLNNEHSFYIIANDNLQEITCVDVPQAIATSSLTKEEVDKLNKVFQKKWKLYNGIWYDAVSRRIISAYEICLYDTKRTRKKIQQISYERIAYTLSSIVANTKESDRIRNIRIREY